MCRLIQQHKNGYFAPTIYGDEQTLKALVNSGTILSKRFPGTWFYVVRDERNKNLF